MPTLPAEHYAAIAAKSNSALSVYLISEGITPTQADSPIPIYLQEEKLADKNKKIMHSSQLKRVIMHYERLTRHRLNAPFARTILCYT